MEVLENSNKGNSSNNLFIWTIAFILIIALILILKIYFLGFYRINSSSMAPTLQVGDMVLVDKYFFKQKKMFKNEVVNFHQGNSNKDFVKRIIALEGDTVLYLNDNVYINSFEFGSGSKFDQSWINHYHQVIVGKGEVFLLGDNLNISSDSREWGTISIRKILGEISYIYFSKDDEGFHFDRIGSSLK